MVLVQEEIDHFFQVSQGLGDAPWGEGGKKPANLRWLGGYDQSSKVEKMDLKVDCDKAAIPPGSPAAPRTQECSLGKRGQNKGYLFTLVGYDHSKKVENIDLKVDCGKGINTASSPAAPRTQGCFLGQKRAKTQKKDGGRVGPTTVKR